MSSIAGFTPLENLGVYSVSKTALFGLTKVLAEELGPDGVRVNCLAPGIIRTKFSKVVRQQNTKKQKEWSACLEEQRNRERETERDRERQRQRQRQRQTEMDRETDRKRAETDRETERERGEEIERVLRAGVREASGVLRGKKHVSGGGGRDLPSPILLNSPFLVCFAAFSVGACALAGWLALLDFAAV